MYTNLFAPIKINHLFCLTEISSAPGTLTGSILDLVPNVVCFLLEALIKPMYIYTHTAQLPLHGLSYIPYLPLQQKYEICM